MRALTLLSVAVLTLSATSCEEAPEGGGNAGGGGAIVGRGY